MQITAAMVKELRDLTGAGMMECKKALTEVQGDVQAAIEWMRKNGLAKADKKSARVAAEGVIGIKVTDDKKQACLLEVNCETDFVAKGEDFMSFVNTLCSVILQARPNSVEDLSSINCDKADKTVDEIRKELVAKIGENIQIRRFKVIDSQGLIGFYSHGGRIGVIVDVQGGDDALAKDIAMHVAANENAVCVSESDMPAELLEKEKEILIEQAKQSGKPEEIIEKMVAGRLKKYISEVTLLGQPFVKDADQTVGKLLKSASAEVHAFYRYAVGEGIEKKAENFAEEVMAQVKAN